MEITALELSDGYGDGDGDGSGYGSGHGSGNGYGYGDGDGNGDGSGSGYGDGSGYGYGYSNGDRSGHGSGNGYGDGYGDGDGSGSGYGDGDGNGDGSGYEQVKYLEAILVNYTAPPNTTKAFWRCNQDGTPANGGSGTVAKAGETETISGPLEICTENALHGTLNPIKWKGKRWFVVALHHPVQTKEDKLGSLKRTFIADLGKCPF